LREIVEPLEGGNCLVDCVQQASVCSRAATCAARDVWIKLGQQISETLDAVTLKEMVQVHNEKQVNAMGLHI
jgi:DNA-binding IscR family transcriptional regulator